MGKISVIIPAYNVENYIEECLRSVINQTYKELEIIVVDDGSTDSTGKICDMLSKEDSRISVIHKENAGVGFARNDGIERASGEYICFLDSDDFLPIDALEIMISSLNRNNADMFIGEVIRTDEKGVPLSEINDESNDRVIDEYEFWEKRNLHEKYVICPAKLYPKSLLSDVRFGKYVNHEDQGILCNVLPKCERIVVSDKVVYYYRMREGSAIHADFGLNQLALSEVLMPEMDYFMSRGWYDLMMYSWGTGTRNIAEGYLKLNLKDREICTFLETRSREYMNYARILLGKVGGLKKKSRLFIYMFSPRLYFFVKNRMGNQIAENRQNWNKD